MLCTVGVAAVLAAWSSSAAPALGPASDRWVCTRVVVWKCILAFSVWEYSAGVNVFSLGFNVWEYSAGVNVFSLGFNVWEYSAGVNEFSLEFNVWEYSAGVNCKR